VSYSVTVRSTIQSISTCRLRSCANARLSLSCHGCSEVVRSARCLCEMLRGGALQWCKMQPREVKSVYTMAVIDARASFHCPDT